ncbi:MAG: argininosuccinate lyase [Alphaproteobacteria bacterium]|jgi:argininosuccinate lyase
MTQNGSNQMWGGRFADKPDAIMEAINASIGYDKRLWLHDIQGSKAHATMLADNNIISKQDLTDIIKGLNQIETEIANNQFNFSPALEDIHMNIEARLREIIGTAAGRLHTGRSRNDQVATDTRLWLRDATDRIISLLVQLQKTLLDKAEHYHDAIMPGFTHLQTAQPVTFGHHLMAYFEMLERDKGRFTDMRQRLNQSPLGSAALAGTPYPIDRFATADALGFCAPMRNSLDGVSARDFSLEFMADAAICSSHLSRFAEEIVIWMTPQFNFIKLSDKWTTGSSIMPQKKNPDAAELIRAKTGRMNGNLMALLTIMKGLPLAYSKDMQEDKEPLFDSADSIELVLAATLGMLKELTANTDSMKKAAESGFAVATDLADWLVQELDMPFREAHHVTGAMVKLAEDKKCMLNELALADMQAINAKITDAIYKVLTPEASVNARTSYGGTAISCVLAQIKERKENLCV